MRWSIAGALAAALCLAGPAAGTAFEARLLTAQGEPAAGYSVAVAGRAVVARCGEDGRFRLEPVPPLPFTLVATSPAGVVAAPLEVTALEPVLRLPAVVRDAVTVVSGVAPSLDLLPASAATVLTREELEQRAPKRLYQALESVAGASKLGDGADSVPVLRNLGRGRTLILVDGARVSAERRAGPSATFVDPAALASIEILRGPGSVVYGSDAFGGVLNAVTRDPDPDRFSLRYSLEAAAGALDTRSAYVAASGAVGPGALLVDGHVGDAGDAEAGGGREIFNSGYTAAGGAVRYAVPAGAGRLRLGLAIDRIEDLGKASVDSRAIRSFYPREESDRVNASWLGSVGTWDALEGSLFYGRYRIVLDRDRAPTAAANRRVDRADTDARDASLRVVAARAASGGRLQVGVDATSRFDLRATTEQVRYGADGATVERIDRTDSIDDASQHSLGLFSTWTRPLAERWSLGIGLRGDRIESENRGGHFGDRRVTHDALSGNLSLTAGPFSGWTTSLQIARGFRSPTLSDRYFRGPSGRGFVTGNPELDPETSLQSDLAVRYARGRTALGLFAYHYRIDDLVERYGAGSDFFFRNRGAATIRGLEMELQAGFGQGWSLEAGAALADGETDGGAAIDDIAAPNGWVNLRRTVGRAFFHGRLTRVSEHDEPGPTELGRDGYTLLDLGGGFRFSEAIEVRLLVRNVGDRRYFASPDSTADRATGRSFSIGLSGKI